MSSGALDAGGAYFWSPVRHKTGHHEVRSYGLECVFRRAVVLCVVVSSSSLPSANVVHWDCELIGTFYVQRRLSLGHEVVKMR